MAPSDDVIFQGGGGGVSGPPVSLGISACNLWNDLESH